MLEEIHAVDRYDFKQGKEKGKGKKKDNDDDAETTASSSTLECMRMNNIFDKFPFFIDLLKK